MGIKSELKLSIRMEENTGTEIQIVRELIREQMLSVPVDEGSLYLSLHQSGLRQGLEQAMGIVDSYLSGRRS